jgi:hypothetical protein
LYLYDTPISEKYTTKDLKSMVEIGGKIYYNTYN